MSDSYYCICIDCGQIEANKEGEHEEFKDKHFGHEVIIMNQREFEVAWYDKKSDEPEWRYAHEDEGTMSEEQPQMSQVISKERAYLKELLDKRREILNRERKHIEFLEKQCERIGHVPMKLNVDIAFCWVCGKRLGWWCDKSHCKYCVYSTDEHVYDGHCIYCGKPEERK